MKHWIKLMSALIAAAAFTSIAATYAFAHGAAARGTTVKVAKSRLGRILVDSRGITLYDFVADRKPGQSSGQGLNQFGGPWWVLSPSGREIHRS